MQLTLPFRLSYNTQISYDMVRDMISFAKQLERILLTVCTLLKHLMLATDIETVLYRKVALCGES